MKYSAVLLLVVLIASISLPGLAQEERKEPLTSPSPGIGELIKKLKSPEASERLQAKTALRQLGKKSAPLVLQELPSAPPEAAYEMIGILGTIRYQEAAGVIEKLWEESEDLNVKLAAALALCQFDHNYSHYQDYLVKQAKKGGERERLRAMQMLGYIRDARVVPPLKEIFYDESQPDQIRQAAVWDLAHTPVPEAAQALVEMVSDPEVDPAEYKPIIIAALQLLAREEDMASIVSELLGKAQGLPIQSGQGKAEPAEEK